MNNQIGLIYIILSSLTLYIITFYLSKRIKEGRRKIIRYSLFPLFIILFAFIFSNLGLLESTYRSLLIFFSIYLLIFLFLLSVILNIRGENITWLNILALGIPILIIALLDKLGVITQVIYFIKIG